MGFPSKLSPRILLVVSRTVLLLALSACLDDPAGPVALTVSTANASFDTTWVGAPGEPIASGVWLRITDQAGQAVAGAELVWETVGRDARLVAPESLSRGDGSATAGWVLGTDASEEQQLRVTVRDAAQETHVLIRARAVPHIVVRLRVAIDTIAVLRLGDTLPVSVDAFDPYGNEFAAPDVRLSVGDSSVARVLENGIVGGPRRGYSVVGVESQHVALQFPLHITQYVVSVVPASDTIRLASLGGQVPVSFQVRDDRNRIVADTQPAVAVADTNVAYWMNGVIRGTSPGTTALQLTLGDATATLVVVVRQRAARLLLTPDTVTFDALADTTTLSVLAWDSLGNAIAQYEGSILVSDTQVVKVFGIRTIESIRPGTTRIIVRDPETAAEASAPVIVAQKPINAGILVSERDGYIFGAVGDSIGAIWAIDRNGYRILGNHLRTTFSDSSRVTVDSMGTLRAQRSGVTQVEAVVDTLVRTATVVIVIPVEVVSDRITEFAVSGLPDSLQVWAPTAQQAPDGSVDLFFAGYAPDSQYGFVRGDLHWANSQDGVHFDYRGMALPRDTSIWEMRSQGVENVFVVPRSDGPGCRMFTSAGNYYWIWQVWTAVSSDCRSWTWEQSPVTMGTPTTAVLPGLLDANGLGRPTGEGMSVWQDSTGTWWMLVGAYPPSAGDVYTWSIGLYRSSDQLHWEFVKTVIYPGDPGSGRERTSYAPSVVELAPGLWRMFFCGDDYNIGPGGKSRIFSALSRDRMTWTVEGTVLDFAGQPYGGLYPTVLGEHLYYLVSDPNSRATMAVAHVRQP